jgi:hypothetical protein
VVVVAIEEAEETVVIVHHVLEIPARLVFVAMRLVVVMAGLVVAADKPLLVFLDELSVADVGAVFALGRQRAPVAAIVPARLVDEAIVLAVPAFQHAIVIAPPIPVAAVVGAAPEAEIECAFAMAMHVVAIARTVPAVPTAIVAAVPLAAIVVAAIIVAELDLGHGIEGIEQDGIRTRDARIFVGAARFPGERPAGCREAHGERHRCQERMEHPDSTRPLHDGALLNDALRD